MKSITQVNGTQDEDSDEQIEELFKKFDDKNDLIDYYSERYS